VRHCVIPKNESERPNALARYDVSDSYPDAVFDRITSLAARLLNVPIAVVILVGVDRICFKSHYGLEDAEIEREPGLCASGILFNTPWIVTDARRDPRVLANPLVAGKFGLRFYAAVPLTASDGFHLGTVCVIDRQPRQISEAELAILRELAGLAMDELACRQASRDALFMQRQHRRHEREKNREENRRLRARIKECLQAEKKSRENEARYHSLADALACSHAELRQLSSALQAIREEERRRVARELHDDLGQLLATLRMDVALLWQQAIETVPSLQLAKHMDQLIATSINSLRRIATNLRPKALDEGGLYFALRSLLKDYSARYAIDCQLKAQEPELVLDDRGSTAIFRIVQESLMNIAQHAQASIVKVELHRNNGIFFINVHDNGCGISKADMHKATSSGSGLVGMRERVNDMEGTMAVAGIPGQGTTIRIELPIA
jgi:signal transduction histidine kinase